MAATRTPAVFNVASFSGATPAETSSSTPLPETPSSGSQLQQPTETQDLSVDKPLIVPPTDDNDTEIDFKNAKSPDDIKVRRIIQMQSILSLLNQGVRRKMLSSMLIHCENQQKKKTTVQLKVTTTTKSLRSKIRR